MTNIYLFMQKRVAYTSSLHLIRKKTGMLTDIFTLQLSVEQCIELADRQQTSSFKCAPITCSDWSSHHCMLYDYSSDICLKTA